MRLDNAKFLGELGAFKGDVLTALSGIKSDVTSGIAGVRADNAKEQVTATRWQVGLIAAVILASASTIATVVLRTKPTAPQQVVMPQASMQQPAPIVIQLPASQAAPPATPQADPPK
ncbi:hypothetical protein ABB25_00930 [Stenotrophomonas koreensis]|uniref:Transmembrane protein n=2 Tax=Stenotrophomonas koreensis TaxID=266128 RepID=A0A0R0C6U7_9GAMM|nr:hypothetical protein ABB25_00930 [Stenotrophomonas koreensis]